jgi:hypothetical protein
MVCHPERSEQGEHLGQLRASEPGSSFESLHPMRMSTLGTRAADRFAISEPVPAALAHRSPRSFSALALPAAFRMTKIGD